MEEALVDAVWNLVRHATFAKDQTITNFVEIEHKRRAIDYFLSTALSKGQRQDSLIRMFS